MHLFFVDQYISLDMMAPIMSRLAKKKKVFLCNFNKVQNLKENQIYKFIINQKNIHEVELVGNKFSKNFFLFYFITRFLFFFSSISNKGYRYWKYIWTNYNFISKKDIINHIKKNNIKTISIDESLVEKKRYFLIAICKELKIPLIMNHGGLYTLKAKLKKNKKFEECTYYMSPNKIPIYTYKLDKNYLKSGKFKQFGSPRFDTEWLTILKKIYKTDVSKNKKKIKVAIFLRPTSLSHSDNLKLLENLKKIDNIEVKTNLKPRDVWPTKYSNLNKNDMESSELIIWSDIVISYATSIILDVICRNKPLIYLNYLQIDKKDGTSWFDDFKFIKKGRNLNYTTQLIKNFEKNNKEYVVRKKNKSSILKKFITEPTGKRILDKYCFFYNKISKTDYKNV